MKGAWRVACQRCSKPGNGQPTDGDASMLFAAAAHVDFSDETPIVLCKSCVRTLEAMSLRAAGLTSRAGSNLGKSPL
jgi:hypothetical protein